MEPSETSKFFKNFPQCPQLFFVFASRTRYFLILAVLVDNIENPYFNPCNPPQKAGNFSSHPPLLKNLNIGLAPPRKW